MMNGTKKLILNKEILEEIFAKILCNRRFYNYFYDNVNIDKSIEKFMLSGRQQLHIALNYFRQIDQVKVFHHKMVGVSNIFLGLF